MEKKSFRNIHIACYDTDEASVLKPATFMDYAQDLAGDNSDMLGFGYSDLIAHNWVWVISRMKMVFHRLPKWSEDVILSTWHRGPDGPFYIRDYRMTDKDGNDLVCATSSWIILDIEERKVVKSEFGTAPETICEDFAVEKACQRLRLPKWVRTEEKYTHTVVYSDIDRNRHANNAMYMVWAMDALDRSFLAAHPVREAEIDFVREAMPGETVTLSVGKDEISGAWYVAGAVGDAQSFLVRFVF